MARPEEEEEEDRIGFLLLSLVAATPPPPPRRKPEKGRRGGTNRLLSFPPSSQLAPRTLQVEKREIGKTENCRLFFLARNSAFKKGTYRIGRVVESSASSPSRSRRGKETGEVIWEARRKFCASAFRKGGEGSLSLARTSTEEEKDIRPSFFPYSSDLMYVDFMKLSDRKYENACLSLFQALTNKDHI